MKIININAPYPPPFSDNLNDKQKNYALANILLSHAAKVAALVNLHGAISTEGNLKAAAVSAPAAVGAVDPNATIDYSFQALGEIAELHLLILKYNPNWQSGGVDNMVAPTGADYTRFCNIATDLMTNLAGKCNPLINTAITQLSQDFVPLGSNTVTNCYWTRFHYDWTQAPGQTGGNSYHCMNDILPFLTAANLSSYSISPTAGPDHPTGPMGLVYFSLFWMDFLTNGNADKFPGPKAPDGDSFFGTGVAANFLPLTTVIPYYTAMAFYQIDTTGGSLPPGFPQPSGNVRSDLTAQMNAIYSLMPTDAIIQNYNYGETPTNYNAMCTNFQSVTNDVSTMKRMPPYSWMSQDEIGIVFGGQGVPFGNPLPTQPSPYGDNPTVDFFTTDIVTPAFMAWINP